MPSLRTRAALIALSAFALLGYGYGSEQDPLVEGFKRVAGQARQGSWTEAQRALELLAPPLAEVQRVLGPDLAPALRDAIRRHSDEALARELARLAHLGIRVKFE